MKTLSCLLVSLLLALPAAADNHDAAVSGARATVAQVLGLFNGRDYDGYLEYIHPEFQGYAGVHTPLLFDEKAKWADFIKGMKALKSVSYIQHNPSYRAFGEDTVLLNAYFVFTTVAQDGSTTVQSGRESTTLVREGGKWRVANYHFSPLF